jgi:predicted  nucleic acid-binding Zn-ribbon protein
VLDRVTKDLATARAAVPGAVGAEAAARAEVGRAEAALAAARAEERALQMKVDEYGKRKLTAIRVLEHGGGDPDAAQRQIVQSDEIIDRSETAILECMERQDALGGALARANEALVVALAARSSAETTAPPRIAALERDESTARAARDAARTVIALELRNRYDLLRQSKKKAAVAKVVAAECTGCRRGIPQQMLADLERDDKFLTCHGCGRWLYVEPHGR